MKAKPGDIVLVDKTEAVYYDGDFDALQNHDEKIKMQIKDYEFKEVSNDSYTATVVTDRSEYHFHIKDEHIIKNLSQNFCDKHETDGLWHDRKERWFCPFCNYE